jgi:hypothetical protein
MTMFDRSFWSIQCLLIFSVSLGSVPEKALSKQTVSERSHEKLLLAHNSMCVTSL